MEVAIYDLDKTLVRRATFTPFLAYAARRLSPLRLGLLPVWIALMAGYKLGFYDRTRLKTWGMRLMLGNASLERLREIGRSFAEKHVARSGWLPGVIRMVREDQSSGRHVAIATAAFEFYAEAFAKMLEIDTVIATRWEHGEIPGGNCYGLEKRRRVENWLAGTGEGFRFVSDSFADTPLLDLASDSVFVTSNPAKRARAQEFGWRVIDGES